MTTNLYALIEGRIGHENFGKPFYVGIGTDKRPYRHLREAKSKAGHRNWRLHEVLASHYSTGIEPVIDIIAAFETKESAGVAEREHIARWGRVGIEVGGILCNRASGGQGPDAALMRMPEIRDRNAKAQLALGKEALAERGQRGGNSASKNPANKVIKSTASTAMNNRTWADPVIRAKRITAMTGKRKTKSAASDEARRANAKKGRTPEAAAKKAAAAKARWADPEFRAAMAEKKRQAWQDPMKRARMLAARAHGTGGKEAVSVDPVERDSEHVSD